MLCTSGSKKVGRYLSNLWELFYWIDGVGPLDVRGIEHSPCETSFPVFGPGLCLEIVLAEGNMEEARIWEHIKHRICFHVGTQATLEPELGPSSHRTVEHFSISIISMIFAIVISLSLCREFLFFLSYYFIFFATA